MTAGVEAAVRLVVFMEPSDEELIRAGEQFCCEADPSATLIANFCRQTRKLPYTPQFVSAAVIRADEEVCDSPARIYGDGNDVFEKTRYAVLKASDALICSIEIVGRDDLRQLLTDIARRSAQSTPFDSLLKMVRDLRGMNAQQKWESFLWATKERGNHGYSEARLGRCISASDVDYWGRCD